MKSDSVGRRSVDAPGADDEASRHPPTIGLTRLEGRGLDDDEARQLGAVVGGAYERPKIVEDLEMALGELQIEWIPVPDDSPWIGHTLADCGFRAKTGITVIAILRQPEPVTGAQPGDTIERGDTLVTVGKAGNYPEFRRLLGGRE